MLALDFAIVIDCYPETTAYATMIDYVDDEPPSLSAELPGKPPFDHPDIAHSILSCLH